MVPISASLIQGGVQSFGGIVSTIPNIVVFSFCVPPCAMAIAHKFFTG